MGLLRRLAIKNFRSIVDANLKLGEVTVIVGPTGSGKSNLVRALQSWAYNASGSAYVTHGSYQARVGVALGHDLKVLWAKSGSSLGDKRAPREAFYFTEDAGSGRRQKYEKIGTACPEDVIAQTGFWPLVVDDLSVEINFSDQDKPWFLLAGEWTPGKVTKIIGKISGVDALILANRDLVAKRVEQIKRSKRASVQADQYRAELVGLGDLERERGLITEAEVKLRQVERDRVILNQALGLVRSIADKRDRLARAKVTCQVLGRAVKRADELAVLAGMERLARAEDLVRRWEQGEHTLSEVEQYQAQERMALQEASQALGEVAGAEGLECPLCGQGAHQECRDALHAQATQASEFGT